MEGRLVAVAVGRPVHGLFTYRLPPLLADRLPPGQRVVVPFGKARAVGFVVGEAEAPPVGVPLRDVGRVLDAGPVFDPHLLELLTWAASYYRHPLGEVLRAALPPGLSMPEEAPAPRPGARELASLTELAKSSPRPRSLPANAILDYLAAAGAEVDLEELTAAIPGARAPLRRLAARGLCAVREVPIEPEHPELALAGAPVPRPTSEQTAALAALEAAVDERAFAPFLLHGVTGSGKTEVYLRAIAKALAQGLGALVLVPEIALTPQLVGRFRARFGDQVAALHSGLKDSERLAEWRRLKSGEAPLAVGVRSAIFAPVQRLGLIVVDEEHDGSFKQEEKLRYQARDLAVVRAKMARCPAVLGSATPSFETLHNARSGRYRLLELTRRVDDRPMPEVEIVDMRLCGRGHVSAAFPQLAGKAKLRSAQLQREDEARADPPAKAAPVSLAEEVGEEAGVPLLSAPLAEAIQSVLDRGRQTILFLNRRGHSTYHLCLTCGQSLTCPECAVSLTWHGNQGRLLCHYCGHARGLPSTCPSCGGPLESLGMGTERVEAEVAARFPGARVARLDRDSATAAEEVTALLASFARGEKDILVGTQMVAKGHDFPGVTLVGVLLADLALNLPDFRASERTFQLLAQVAGRAGRGAEPGRVLVQTFNPEAPAVASVVGHDFKSFAEGELRLRKSYHYPPYCRLLAARIDGAHPDETAQAARAVALAASAVIRAGKAPLRLLGPALAPLSKLRGRTRWQLLVKGPTAHALLPVAEAMEAAARELKGNVRASLDVDPLAML